jgi:hypothetical protein
MAYSLSTAAKDYYYGLQKPLNAHVISIWKHKDSRWDLVIVIIEGLSFTDIHVNTRL